MDDCTGDDYTCNSTIGYHPSTRIFFNLLGLRNLVSGNVVTLANGKRVFVYWEPEKASASPMDFQFHETSEGKPTPVVPVPNFATWKEEFEYLLRMSVQYSAPESSCNNPTDE